MALQWNTKNAKVTNLEALGRRISGGEAVPTLKEIKLQKGKMMMPILTGDGTDFTGERTFSIALPPYVILKAVEEEEGEILDKVLVTAPPEHEADLRKFLLTLEMQVLNAFSEKAERMLEVQFPGKNLIRCDKLMSNEQLFLKTPKYIPNYSKKGEEGYGIKEEWSISRLEALKKKVGGNGVYAFSIHSLYGVLDDGKKTEFDSRFWGFAFRLEADPMNIGPPIKPVSAGAKRKLLIEQAQKLERQEEEKAAKKAK